MTIADAFLDQHSSRLAAAEANVWQSSGFYEVSVDVRLADGTAERGSRIVKVTR